MKVLDLLMEEVERLSPTNDCLWPAPFNEDTLESAMAFYSECRTWNEAEREVQPTPKDWEYLWVLGREWFEAKRTGGVLHILKCRRMLVSWFCRILELHQMGLSRQDMVLGGDKFLMACRHIWRYEHIYRDLQKTHPDWNLEDHKHLSFQGERALQRFSLPNGSTCSAVNGEGTNIQGEGYSIVVFEEFSLYPHAETMLGQAKIVTEASAGKTGGFTVTIANPEWNWGYNNIVSGG